MPYFIACCSVFFYKEITFPKLPQILLDSSATTAIVMLLIGTSISMSWALSYENIPQEISSGLLGVSDNPVVILLIINLLLLFVGIFMDMTPAVLIFTPIFLPVVTKLGMDPVHFGIIMVLNLCIGLCTPPVGSVLFVGVGHSQNYDREGRQAPASAFCRDDHCLDVGDLHPRPKLVAAEFVQSLAASLSPAHSSHPQNNLKIGVEQFDRGCSSPW